MIELPATEEVPMDHPNHTPIPPQKLYERNPVLFVIWSYAYWIKQIARAKTPGFPTKEAA